MRHRALSKRLLYFAEQCGKHPAKCISLDVELAFFCRKVSVAANRVGRITAKHLRPGCIRTYVCCGRASQCRGEKKCVEVEKIDRKERACCCVFICSRCTIVTNSPLPEGSDVRGSWIAVTPFYPTLLAARSGSGLALNAVSFEHIFLLFLVVPACLSSLLFFPRVGVHDHSYSNSISKVCFVEVHVVSFPLIFPLFHD